METTDNQIEYDVAVDVNGRRYNASIYRFDGKWKGYYLDGLNAAVVSSRHTIDELLDELKYHIEKLKG